MPKKQMGKPLNRSDEDLDRLSQITPADIEASKAAVSGTVIGKILDADLVDDQDDREAQA